MCLGDEQRRVGSSTIGGHICATSFGGSLDDRLNVMTFMLYL